MAVTEEQVLVAVQGTKGAYSQLAASGMFPNGTFLYFRTFDAVASAVKEKMCAYGVLPIENNTYGSVKDVYRILRTRDVSIVHASRLRIRHVLLAKERTKLPDVTKIVSHEQALGQCGKFLHSLGDRVSIEACLNTAVAARLVSESGKGDIAAISSEECAGIYGLRVLKRDIADSDYNFTRFLCIAKEPYTEPGADRISLILSLPHVAGSLAKVLGLFADAGINLLKIESTPIPGKDFEFLFYIDLEASSEDRRTAGLLDVVAAMCPSFTFLGCYREDV